MSAGLFKAPTANYWSSSLNGSINDSVDTFTLNSTTNLQSPGYLIIDRENNSGTATPNSREVVKFTGISGSDVTGVTRAADNSTARSHADGALVEAMYTVGMHNDQRDAINAEHAVAGTHSIIAAATVSAVNIVNARIATASITTLNAANYKGLKGVFEWAYTDALATSLTTVNRKPFWRATKNMTLSKVWAGVVSAPSLSATELDISWSASPNGTFASIFSVKPMLNVGITDLTSAATGGTLSLTSLASGIILQPTIEKTDEQAATLTLQLTGTER